MSFLVLIQQRGGNRESKSGPLLSHFTKDVTHFAAKAEKGVSFTEVTFFLTIQFCSMFLVFNLVLLH